jgi:lysozyme family protein
MSDFKIAIKTILKQEGGFSNDPKDPGGATNYGVSLPFLQSLGEIEGDFDLDGDVDIDDIIKMTPDQATEIYKRHWWQKYGYQRIISQSVATKVFSLSVNMGSVQAHKCLQRSVRATSGVILKEDGVLGNLTFAEVNYSYAEVLLGSLKSEGAGFYRSLNKPHYINGWLKRAYE